MIIWIITGLWVLLGCAELAHLITMISDRSLQTYIMLCGVSVLTGFLIYASLGVFELKRKRRHAAYSESEGAEAAELRSKSLLYMILFLVLTGVTIYHFVSGYVPVLQDAVYEITLGNIKSDSIMTLNPFLGVETSNPMPFRMKILGLSSLYAMLITISKQSAYMIMCKVVPMVIWGLSILLSWAFAKQFFPKEVHKRWLFIAMVALVYVATAGSVGMPGYRLFYAGFSGETIRNVLLMPYTVYVSWKKQWGLAILAVLTEVGLVWTTFGVGYCMLIAVCMFAIHLWSERRAEHADGME